MSAFEATPPGQDGTIAHSEGQPDGFALASGVRMTAPQAGLMTLDVPQDELRRRLELTGLLEESAVARAFDTHRKPGVSDEAVLERSLVEGLGHTPAARHLTRLILSMEPSSLMVGDSVAVKHLGTGSFARAFLTVRDGKLSVVKQMLAEKGKIPALKARFALEIEMMRTKLAGCRIPQVESYGGFETDTPFVRTKHIAGHSLDKVIASPAPAPLRMQAVNHLGRLIAEAMAEIHGRGVVHRDLKPSNILAGDAGETWILDMGLAKAALMEDQAALTQDGETLGTPAYMAPEQIADIRKADEFADVYAYACILYELITGRRPYTARSNFELMKLQQGAALPDLSVIRDMELQRHVEMMFHKTDPKKRGTMEQHADFFRERQQRAGRRGASALAMHAIPLAVSPTAKDALGSQYADGPEMRTALDELYPPGTALDIQRTGLVPRGKMTVLLGGAAALLLASVITVPPMLKGKQDVGPAPDGPAPQLPSADAQKTDTPRAAAPAARSDIPVPKRPPLFAMGRGPGEPVLDLYPGTKLEKVLTAKDTLAISVNGHPGAMIFVDADGIRKLLQLGEHDELPESLRNGQMGMALRTKNDSGRFIAVEKVGAICIEDAPGKESKVSVYAIAPDFRPLPDVPAQPYDELFRHSVVKTIFAPAEDDNIVVGLPPEATFPQPLRELPWKDITKQIVGINRQNIERVNRDR